jgi:hypothetical protein
VLKNVSNDATFNTDPVVNTLEVNGKMSDDYSMTDDIDDFND